MHRNPCGEAAAAAPAPANPAQRPGPSGPPRASATPTERN